VPRRPLRLTTISKNTFPIDYFTHTHCGWLALCRWTFQPKCSFIICQRGNMKLSDNCLTYFLKYLHTSRMIACGFGFLPDAHYTKKWWGGQRGALGRNSSNRRHVGLLRSEHMFSKCPDALQPKALRTDATQKLFCTIQ